MTASDAKRSASAIRTLKVHARPGDKEYMSTVSDAVRRELDALRTELDAHLRSPATPAVRSPPTTVGRSDGASVASEGPPPAMPQPSYPGPARGAERVRVPDPCEVVVDGGTALLVDISHLGAQILSPQAVRPNHPVRMWLPRDGQAVLCPGRVVWALFEVVPGGGRYRAGLQFTDMDADAVNAFLDRYRAETYRSFA